MKLIKHNLQKETNPINLVVNTNLSSLLVITVGDIINSELNDTTYKKLIGRMISCMILPNQLLIDSELKDTFYDSKLWNVVIKHCVNENTSIIYC